MTEASCAATRPRPKGLFDTNLGFPLEDPAWTSFFAAEHCDVSGTTDLDALTAALGAHQAEFSYLPAANVFALRHDGAYRGLASALSARTRTATQSSVLIVKASHPATRWQELRNARLGYINTYCTTSYVAPALLLAREHLALRAFFNAMPVAAWQGQIDAVVGGSIDVTMVHEDVWRARPENAAQTRILARLDGLPNPAVIVRSDADAFASRLKDALLAVAPAAQTGVLYAGFTDYQKAPMRRFFAELENLD